MPLSERYKIDFSGFERDMISDALNRMLSQHYDKSVLRQFVAVFVRQCQELYDACIDIQRMRTVFEATATNLDALGRIVGEDRVAWHYNEDGWMFFDRQGQGFNQTPMWCLNAPMGSYVPVEDAQYQINIIARAVKNHTLVGSVPEELNLASLLLGIYISFEKTGPNTVRLIVPSSISKTTLYYLTRNYTDERVDEAYNMPYPATLSFSGVIMYAPNEFLIFDRDNKGYDISPMAVGVTHEWR